MRRVRLKSKCCVSCFSDPFIRNIIQEESHETGRCDYCGSSPRRLIAISDLAGYFHNLVNMYDQSDDGDTLISLVQDGWGIFSHKLHAADGSRGLLEDILNSDWDDDSGEWPINAYDTYRSRDVLPELESWEELCDVVREEPDAEPDFGEYFDEELAAAETTIPVGTILYRARLGWAAINERGHRVPFRGDDIGAPPLNKSSVGRANRKDEVVLYCAESEATAIAEVRPVRGYWVSTCQLRTRMELRILDLVDGIPKLHPFTDDTLAWSVQFTELLRSFAGALSKPLARSDDVADYLPSQKLSKHIERLGYDGTRYPSAMEEAGVNLVVFDHSLAEILDSNLVEVTSTEIGYHTRWFPR